MFGSSFLSTIYTYGSLLKSFCCFYSNNLFKYYFSPPISKASRKLTNLLVPYIYHEKQYNLILPITDSSRWVKVIDEEGNDITKEIEVYAGPWKNFFKLNNKVSDIFPSYESLTFYYDNDETKTLNFNDLLVV